MFGKNAHIEGFTMVEILFAVAIITVSLVGASALISTWGRQASWAEDDREITDLLLSAKTCVSGFWVPYLRSVAATDWGTPVWFGTGNTECATGTSFTGQYVSASAPKITMEGYLGSGTGGVSNRDYGAYFSTSTGWVPDTAAKVTVSVTNGTILRSLTFRTDSN